MSDYSSVKVIVDGFVRSNFSALIPNEIALLIAKYYPFIILFVQDRIFDFCDQERELVATFLNETLKIKLYELQSKVIYNGKKDGQDSRKWHGLVDGIPNLLTVIETKCGNIFGMFNSTAYNGNGYQSDHLAFLCLIRSKNEKYKPKMFKVKDKHKDSVIYGIAYCGPCVGGSFDVGIFAGGNDSNYCSHSAQNTYFDGFDEYGYDNQVLCGSPSNPFCIINIASYSITSVLD